ncbi:MAG: transcription termination/antitermination protein NusG [Thermoanaerobaculia bacterium]
MPILKREPDVFPVQIFDLQQPWWVAHLRSRQEKAFARYLRLYDIAFYLPQTEKCVRRNGRTIVSSLPLFSGYVFFRGSSADTARALRSHVVVNLLAPFDQQTFEAELRQLYDLQSSSGRLTLHPHLRAGDAVLITEGVFAGYRGVIQRHPAGERVIVSVSFIRQSVAVELDRESVRPQRTASAFAEIVRS